MRAVRIAVATLVCAGSSLLLSPQDSGSRATHYVALDQNGHHPRLRHESAPQPSSIMMNVFPNMKSPQDGAQLPANPQVPSGAPAPAAPKRRPPPQFSPHLKPPNGKTDGKIYPA